MIDDEREPVSVIVPDAGIVVCDEVERRTEVASAELIFSPDGRDGADEMGWVVDWEVREMLFMEPVLPSMIDFSLELKLVTAALYLSVFSL